MPMERKPIFSHWKIVVHIRECLYNLGDYGASHVETRLTQDRKTRKRRSVPNEWLYVDGVWILKEGRVLFEVVPPTS